MVHSDFVKALQDILLSRRAIHFMNTLFPDATIQDLQTIENLCIICRENMTVTGDVPKTTMFMNLKYNLYLKINLIQKYKMVCI